MIHQLHKIVPGSESLYRTSSKTRHTSTSTRTWRSPPSRTWTNSTVPIDTTPRWVEAPLFNGDDPSDNIEGSWMDFLLAIHHRFAPELIVEEVSLVVDENQFSAQPSNKESSNILTKGIGSDTTICGGSLETGTAHEENAPTNVESAITLVKEDTLLDLGKENELDDIHGAHEKE